MKTSSDPNMQQRRVTLSGLMLCVLLLTVVFSGSTVSAQLVRAPLSDGFKRTSSIDVTVDEMLGPNKPRTQAEPILGPGYPNLWIAEVQYKPIRHRLMPITDPKTRIKKEELVWYFVYRIIPRDYTELAGNKQEDLRAKLDNIDLKPSNHLDDQLVQPLVLPRFALRIDDDHSGKTYVDEVNLEIQKAVFEREFGEKAADLTLLNSITGIQDISPPVSGNDALVDPLKNAIYGVAVWRNVDPDTDYFTLFMSGFSNAYQMGRINGDLIVQQKVIEQRFGRPGDRFRQQESEFRFFDEAQLRSNGSLEVTMEGILSTFVLGRQAPAFVDQLRLQLRNTSNGKTEWPHWQYQAREAELTAPQLEPILRHQPTSEATAAKN